mgnify:CR=1 FL=1
MMTRNMLEPGLAALPTAVILWSGVDLAFGKDRTGITILTPEDVRKFVSRNAKPAAALSDGGL